MKLERGAPLNLSLAFDEHAKLAAGRLAMSEGLAQLEWSPEIIAQQLDALPEGWGYLVMRRRLRNGGIDIASLSGLELLALVGETARGALSFEPASRPADGVETLDLDALAKEAAAIIEGKEGTLGDTLAELGGSAGGARPKVNVGFDDKGNISGGAGEVARGHLAWIVKFRASEDPVDIGPIEFAYAEMASAAGLEVPEHRLISSRKSAGYFATRRFDRPEPGRRIHMVSMEGAMESPSQTPSSYDMLMRLTRGITRNSEDVAAVFRRMVFNVLAHNRDDHSRQHAFLMDEGGVWRLAPVYDLTYAPGPGGEHYLDIDGEGRRPTRAHVERLGQKQGLSARQISAIIDDVGAAVASWESFAKAAAVSSASLQQISLAHARVALDF